MKNRLIITVSDIDGTKSYNIHQLVRKFIFLIILVLFIVIGISFWVIKFLNEEVDTIKLQKKQEVAILEEQASKLKAQNSLFSAQIKSKVKDIEELSSKLDDIEEIIGIKKDDEANLIQRATLAELSSSQKMHMLSTIPNNSPLKETKVSGNFGYRIHPVTKKRQFHRGIDLKADRKTDVFATADGVVRYVEEKNKGDFGRVVIILHNYGFETVYAHLSKTNVKIGDIVRKGDKVGLSGNSGRSTGPHLHYEVRFATKVLQPKDFMNWDLQNYEQLFETQRRVPWESLVEMIRDQQVKMEQQ